MCILYTLYIGTGTQVEQGARGDQSVIILTDDSMG